MDIAPFAVEQWMNEFENDCKFNLAETCVASLTVQELLDLAGVGAAALDEILTMKLTYGAIEGSERLRLAISDLYDGTTPDQILVTHGAIGANKLVHEALVGPGDRVVSVQPTYQQHYALPASYGAEVDILTLRPENNYLPDLNELQTLMRPQTKLIALNNPNNPSGALMPTAMLQDMASMAEPVDATILCDEVYRGTEQPGVDPAKAIADVYHRGISTGSMSKAFSLAGLRLGWIAGPTDVISSCERHRDYNTISVGMINDYLAAIALENADRLLERSRGITTTNLAILSDWVDAEPRVNWVKPTAGTTALLRLDVDMPSDQFCRSLLADTGVLFMPGSALEAEGTVRIGYANTTEVLEQGLTEVSSFLSNLPPHL